MALLLQHSVLAHNMKSLLFMQLILWMDELQVPCGLLFFFFKDTLFKDVLIELLNKNMVFLSSWSRTVSFCLSLSDKILTLTFLLKMINLCFKDCIFREHNVFLSQTVLPVCSPDYNSFFGITFWATQKVYCWHASWASSRARLRIYCLFLWNSQPSSGPSFKRQWHLTAPNSVSLLKQHTAHNKLSTTGTNGTHISKRLENRSVG